MAIFDAEKYMREAREESEVPEWSMAAGALLVFVIGAYMLYQALTAGGGGTTGGSDQNVDQTGGVHESIGLVVELEGSGNVL